MRAPFEKFHVYSSPANFHCFIITVNPLGMGFQDQLSEIERQFIEQAIREKLERERTGKP